MTQNQKTLLSVGGGVGGLLFLWRRYHQSRSSSSTPRVPPGYGAGGQIAPFTPQNPLVLQPGESIYDPNTLGLYNTPTAPNAGLPGPNHPDYVLNVKYPSSVTKKTHHKKPTKRKVNTKKHTKKTVKAGN